MKNIITYIILATFQTQERAAVPAAVEEVGTEILTDVVKQAVEKQIAIIAEQQQKAQEFIDKKVSPRKFSFPSIS